MSYVAFGIIVIYIIFHIFSALRTKLNVLDNKQMNEAFMDTMNNQGGPLHVEASNSAE